MRWLIGLVVIAALGAAGWFVLRSRDGASKQTPASNDGAGSEANVARPSASPPPSLGPVNEQQEQGEHKLIEEFSAEQKLTTIESEKVLASLQAFQNERRQLFADLKDRKIAIEDLSKRLRELRVEMNQSFERELGKARSDVLIERMRIANGGERTSPK